MAKALGGEMDVVMLGPGYPGEMPLFTGGLAAVGARVIGVGDQPADALPALARHALSDYVQIATWGDEDGAVRTVLDALRGQNVDRVESLWEPTMLLAARLREAIGVPGLTVAQTVPFRDKGRMKEVLDAAGIRTPLARRSTTVAGCWEAAEAIGYPIIVKPIAGAGSLDTYRIESAGEMEAALSRLGHIAEVSVEEFIDGEEFTYDTICAAGRIAFDNICWYRPRPLVGKQVERTTQQVIALRDMTVPDLAGGRAMGEAVIAAMGFESGFTHMEWYRTSNGEVVFGEIGARAPGARLTDLMNFACDTDLFRGWAEAVCQGTFSQPSERLYNVGMAILRAYGQGRITAIQGLEHVMATIGEHVVNVDLVGIGEPRRDWRATVLSDGIVVVRHPDLSTTLQMVEQVADEVRLYAE
jgi:formate-dependent phosphoribosylglycinamide formyltransferase (GAR transformylase)